MSASPPMYLIFGATGKQGAAVIASLLKRVSGSSIRAFTRNPSSPSAKRLASENVELCQGNMADETSVSSALTGVTVVYLVTDYTQGPKNEIHHATTVIRAAEAAGVQHIVFSSIDCVGDGPTGVPIFDSKIETERILRESSLQWTILRPVTFMNGLPLNPGLERAFTLGIMRGATANRKMAFVATEDIGWFAAEAIVNPNTYSGAVLPLAGDEMSIDEAAIALGKAQGANVRIVPLPSWLVYAILPKSIAKMMKFLRDSERPTSANIADLKARHPDLLNFQDWLLLKTDKRERE